MWIWKRGIPGNGEYNLLKYTLNQTVYIDWKWRNMGLEIKQIFCFESNKCKKVVNMIIYTKIQYEYYANILHRPKMKNMGIGKR